MTRVRIENATYLLTIDANDRILTDATVTIDDGVITAITTEPRADDGADDGAAEPDESGSAPASEAEADPSVRPLAGSDGSATERQRGSADGLRPHDGSAGAEAALEPSHGGSEDASPDVVVIDARDKLVMPGLVNLHTHLPMTLLRGLAENVDLQGFLTRVWAAEGAVMDPETVELGATLGAL
ncbi:MAG TPA: hypothetical protein VLQ78_04825, partial [Ornithinibacter sp.]|nr:hypothetical protein [Ornithinibacter sp.]